MKNEKLSLRIKQEIKKILLEKAKNENRTLSNYVNMILENHVKNNKIEAGDSEAIEVSTIEITNIEKI